MYNTKVKRNQNYEIIIFIKDNFFVDFIECGCNECNIIKINTI